MKLAARKARGNSPFSEFIRNAKPSEKKKVYRRVLEKATERQKEVLRKAASRR